jgi:hypothetical protein
MSILRGSVNPYADERLIAANDRMGAAVSLGE